MNCLRTLLPSAQNTALFLHSLPSRVSHACSGPRRTSASSSTPIPTHRLLTSPEHITCKNSLRLSLLIAIPINITALPLISTLFYLNTVESPSIQNPMFGHTSALASKSQHFYKPNGFLNKTQISGTLPDLLTHEDLLTIPCINPNDSNLTQLAQQLKDLDTANNSQFINSYYISSTIATITLSMIFLACLGLNYIKPIHKSYDYLTPLNKITIFCFTLLLLTPLAAILYFATPILSQQICLSNSIQSSKNS